LKFSFDKCMQLALEDLDAFEDYRAELVKQIIEEAKPENQQKLKGLQFRIDMERRKARTPMSSCLKLYGMMVDYFYDEHLPGIIMSLSSREPTVRKILPENSRDATIYTWPEGRRKKGKPPE